jgi:UDP-N-acetylglucosamine enolpyruvyl transferase
MKTSAQPSTVTDYETVTVLGGTRINGDIAIGGFKHALVLCVAAAAATQGVVRIDGCPEIEETRVLARIVQQLGGSVDLAGKVLNIDGSTIVSPSMSDVDTASIHGSVYLLPALLARFGSVTMSRSGGCQIGNGPGHRPIAQYVQVFEHFGAIARETSAGSLTVRASKLTGCEIDMLNFTSDRQLRTGPLYSGATKTALLTAAVAHGTSVIHAPYPKPDVTELVTLLRKLGVGVAVTADGAYVVDGCGGPIKSSGVEHTLIPDLIEIVTWICAGALLAGSPMTLHAARMSDVHAALAPELEVLSSMGVDVGWQLQSCTVRPAGPLAPAHIKVESHGVFSDSQPLLALLTAYAHGRSTITETVWSQRFGYAKGFAALGIDVTLEPSQLTIRGPRRHMCVGRQHLAASDLRGAASLLLAALTVPVTTTLSGMHHLRRGYPDLPGQLVRCGADIKTGVA